MRDRATKSDRAKLRKLRAMRRSRPKRASKAREPRKYHRLSDLFPATDAQVRAERANRPAVPVERKRNWLRRVAEAILPRRFQRRMGAA